MYLIIEGLDTILRALTLVGFHWKGQAGGIGYVWHSSETLARHVQGPGFGSPWHQQGKDVDVEMEMVEMGMMEIEMI